MSDKADQAPRTFVPLSEYRVPPLPADKTLEDLWRRLRKWFDREDDAGPTVEAEMLDRAATEDLDAIAAPPACQPVLDELDATYAPWRRARGGAGRVQVVVLPPCDGDGVVHAWAVQHGIDILPPPERERLMGDAPPDAPDLSGGGHLVIPDLSRWFLRHEGCLQALRALMDAILTSDRRIMVGCNSWTWAYLAKAVDAAQILPRPYTFQAFDADRLRSWFADLSAEVRGEGMSFRLARDGTPLFEEEAEDGKAQDFFVTLAARSLGIPWIAWHIWRDAVSALHPDEEESDRPVPEVHDDETYWISPSSAPDLPQGSTREALLVCQALLIHGSLTPRTLAAVLPLTGPLGTIPTLIDSGIVQSRDGAFSIRPQAYPGLRNGLANAGFPLDMG